jgi:hypothetical protein
MSSEKLGAFSSEFKLFVEAEDKFTGNIWKADFGQRYIEELTTKTGNP